jgi:methyltransferase-like protein
MKDKAQNVSSEEEPEVNAIQPCAADAANSDENNRIFEAALKETNEKYNAMLKKLSDN